jgi:nitrate/TMAO reductase-like tetraheme cytochrome c subunit
VRLIPRRAAGRPERTGRLRRTGSILLRPLRTVHSSVRAVWSAWTGISKRRRRQATFVLVVVPLVVLGTLSAAAFHWTSQPSFCAKCHPMRPFIEGWEAGPHRTVNCEDCHLPPGTVGFVGGKIAALQVVVDYMRGDYRDESFNAVVSNASCLSCHAKVETDVLVRDGIRVDHRGIIKLGGKCMTCHSTIAHGDATPVGARTYPTMSTCFTCHNGTIASTECTVCHVKGDWRLPPANASGTQARPAKGS